jgi:hypothetical protein
MPYTDVRKAIWYISSSWVQILVRFVLLVLFVSLVELVGLRSNQLNELNQSNQLNGCINFRFPDT